MAEKIIRDPVHDVIALDLGDAADALIFRLLATREVQRLRRIRQLGLASLAYPGADHSRYSHSLGVFETARKILARLDRAGVALDGGTHEATLVAALLHDLGHGPFSHVFERVSGVHHEGFTRRLILDPDSEVHQVLIRHETTLPERVVDLLTGNEASDPVAQDVLSSQLDADRLDYLLRDNLMTGSRYGRYDLAWLLQAMTVADGRLAISGKGLSAAEAYLQARYHMYRHVYFHKVVRAAEGMVKLALQRARELILSESSGDVAGVNLAVPPGSGSVAKVLVSDRLSSEEFGDLDDVSVMGCFKAWARSGDAILADLCGGLLNRRLYKTIDLSYHADPLAASEAATRAVEEAGGNPHYALFYDSPGNVPYLAGGRQIIRVEMPGGVVDLADASPMVAALSRQGEQRRFHRLHVHPDYRGVAERAIEESV